MCREATLSAAFGVIVGVLCLASGACGGRDSAQTEASDDAAWGRAPTQAPREPTRT